MCMQLRTITLGTATVAIFGALVVLFVQVRAPQEIVVPEDALSRARSRYELTRGAPAPGAFQAHRSEAASRPSHRPGAGGPPSVSAVRPARGRAAQDRPASQRGSGRPADHAAGTSPLLVEKRESIRQAYDMGDFDTSLTQAEEFLRQDPSNAYVKRVAVVSACAVDDAVTARRYLQDMDAQDQRIVTKRCARFGVQL
jgi:hypothetical protein